MPFWYVLYVMAAAALMANPAIEREHTDFGIAMSLFMALIHLANASLIYDYRHGLLNVWQLATILTSHWLPLIGICIVVEGGMEVAKPVVFVAGAFVIIALYNK